MRCAWDSTEDRLVQEFAGTGVPETNSRSWTRRMSSLLAKLARVDEANNGAQLLPGALNTEEAILSVEDSSHSADYELRQRAEKRKLEEDQMAISMKKLKYKETRELELLRRKAEDASSLIQLQEIEVLEEALWE